MPARALLTPAELARVPSLDRLDEEVQAGLPGEHADRMEAAWKADQFYLGRGKQFLRAREAEDPLDFVQRPKRTSNLARKVVRLLSSQLYACPPTRAVEGSADLSSWYAGVLATTDADAKLLHADRAAALGHAAALEIEPTGDPARPLRLYLWKPHEFTVWHDTDDPADVWAVCTRSVIPAGPGKVRARYRVWSAAERRTYVTRPYAKGENSGGRRADVLVRDESGPSPYPGVLPFAFVRFDGPAVCEFWEGGIGGPLVELNAEADRCLTDLAEHLQQFLNPRTYGRNIDPLQRYLQKVGGIVHLTGTVDPASAGMLPPDIFHVQATLGVEAAWLDLRNTVDAGLEELDVPAAMVHTLDPAGADPSGVAVVAKRLPFYEQAAGRQNFAKAAEAGLYATCCAVAGVHYNDARLQAAAADPAKLLATWPEAKIPLPTPERNDGDDWELERGLTDPIEVLARRRGLTLDQAAELAEAIADRRAAWSDIMGAAELAEAAAAGERAAAASGDGGSDSGPDGADDPDDQAE